jgi:hypothetical protein
MAGGSPYVPDQRALDEFFARLRHVFQFWRDQLFMAPTMTEYLDWPPQPQTVT